MSRQGNRPRRGTALLPALLALSLGGCAASIAPVDVTRFHGQTAPSTGSIAIVPVDPRDSGSLEFRASADAVATALKRAGFAVLPPGAKDAPLQAVVDVRREVIQPNDQRRSPVSVGVGGSTGSYGSGFGLGIGIDLSGKPKPVVSTQLRVQIRAAGADQALWEGRAETAAKEGSQEAQPGAMAGRLADALFRDYPGVSGRTTSVK